MTSDEVRQRWESAVTRLFEKDNFLLKIDVSERAISHRLGMYLAEKFPLWDVDCEYNRKGLLRKPKCMHRYKELLEHAGLKIPKKWESVP